MITRERGIKIGLPLLVLLAGFLLMQLMLNQRRPPEPMARESAGVLVEVLEMRPQAHQVVVNGSGTVQAAREISLVPRVSGQVSRLGENFVAGGFVRRDELLIQIDPVDYELALKRAEAAVARARVALETTAGRAAVARLEWQNFGSTDSAEPNPLALYEPQLAEARADLAAAEADLAAAALNLARTEIRAPFNARVRGRAVEIGQYVQAGTGIATLTGTDSAEVVVPVALADLPWLTIPRPGTPAPGSAARVLLEVAGRQHQWPGRLLRTLGEVEPQGRMTQLVIAVTDPYGLADPAPPAIDLLPGTFVGVELAGRRLEEVFVLPRPALREDNTVWLLNEEDRLAIRPVQVAREERDVVLIDGGLAAGDRVVLTELAGAAEGLTLRVNAGESPAP
ncbi:efflux RND transporter periplasmic adaptor subunit [Desulfurivibrio sp. D14AmB]|uniref:efflux RND transporter periplasmic adaptor subunit n=1 Tax=Desulfurivibrio sp. D14AmB TaxID=3374370 RepID=UPI00376EB2E6